jgi:RNase adaptor protein for sRNA GlmZ degradation
VSIGCVGGLHRVLVQASKVVEPMV